MPPVLSARHMLWWGLGIAAAAVVAHVLVTELIFANGVQIPRIVLSAVSPLLTTFTVVGSGMVAGSVVVRALGRDGGRSADSPAAMSVLD